MVTRIKKVLAGIALLSVELIIVLLLFGISLFGFIYIANNIFNVNDTSLDTQTFLIVRPFITDFNTVVMRVITFFATHKFLLPANILLALIFLFKKHKWYYIKIPVVSLSSFIVMASLKVFFSRSRPDDPVYQAARGFSFPSGHAMSAMTFYGLLIYIVWKYVNNNVLKWGLIVLLILFIFLIGFSRVYLRVHYASDVLAGFAMGLIWLVFSLWVMGYIEKFSRRKIAPVVNEPG